MCLPRGRRIDTLVVVRRRWNDHRSAKAPLAALREVVIKSDPGGVCGPIPRPFLYARIWCDQLIEGEAIHNCEPAMFPHELQLCVNEADNSAALNSLVRALLRK